MKLFDRKFGREYLQSVPLGPGVYRFANAEGRTIYVGKAKNLRRRLAQYRRARKGKARKIVQAATSLSWEPLLSDLEACLQELRDIQKDRPKLNVAGAFSYRYPLIGILTEEKTCTLCFTTTPEVFPSLRFHGAFRSREVTAEAFFALVRLLRFVGHASPFSREERKAYSYEITLRQLPQTWPAEIEAFLRGRSDALLQTLFHRLLEHAGARAKSEEVQEGLEALALFWRQECLPLAEAIALVGFETYPVPQTERDPLFVRARKEKTP
ncbi:GIY-YIG nuclease family protein [bacterium]|nr:GIY-YIG nuclease family protein [bacterium]